MADDGPRPEDAPNARGPGEEVPIKQVAKGPVPQVMAQPGNDQAGAYCQEVQPGEGPRLRGPQPIHQRPGQMAHPERMLEARVRRAREHVRRHAQLLQAPQPLEVRRVHDLEEVLPPVGRHDETKGPSKGTKEIHDHHQHRAQEEGGTSVCSRGGAAGEKRKRTHGASERAREKGSTSSRA